MPDSFASGSAVLMREKRIALPEPDVRSQAVADLVMTAASARAKASPELMATPDKEAETTARLDAAQLRQGHRQIGARKTGVKVLLVSGLVALLALGGMGLFHHNALNANLEATNASSKSWTKYPPLPDPNLTPGDVGTPGTTTVFTADIQQDILSRYHIDAQNPSRVVCRLIPAELGGTDDPKNLFPLSPWFAGLKARLDQKLVQEVQQGALTPQQARSELSAD